MTETLTSLDKSIAFLIDGATEKGAKLVDLLYSQAPEVIEQLLIYHGVESAIKCLGAVLLIVGWPFVLVKLVKSYRKIFEDHIDKNWSEHPGFAIPVIFGSIISLIITQITGWNTINFTWLKIWIAPKVYLLEFIGNFTK